MTRSSSSANTSSLTSSNEYPLEPGEHGGELVAALGWDGNLLDRNLTTLNLGGESFAHIKSVGPKNRRIPPECTALCRFLPLMAPNIRDLRSRRNSASQGSDAFSLRHYLAIEAGLDGMIFPSVQVGHQSTNVVLFHHASRVEKVPIPKGTKVTARLETTDSDGVHPEYWVCEEVPAPSVSETLSTNQIPVIPLDFHDQIERFDSWRNTLIIDLPNIEVRHINAVSFVSDPHPVSRSRIEKQDSTFGNNVDTDSGTFEEEADNPFT